ncbi:MAG TPA: pilin [Candidatus Saccharimonadales bacterium]|nr:pilin [Candidatus Saccharimonadales bacterium]
MIKKIRQITAGISVLAMLMLPMLSAAPAFAQSADIQNNECSGANDLSVDSSSGCGGTSGATTSFDHIITVVIDILSVVVGIVAVIMIIVAGFRYVTSGGKQESVTGAKNTILYAVIGLIIVALAQIIVRFVLNKATSTGS